MKAPGPRSGGFPFLLPSPLDEEVLLGRTLKEHGEALAAQAPQGAFVVLDPQCPLVPSAFVAELVAGVRSTGRPHAGVRPVTDTVKVLHDGAVGTTLDRAVLLQLASPVVLPGPMDVPATLAALVDGLDDVVLVEAPPLARRVSDRSDIALLAALAHPG